LEDNEMSGTQAHETHLLHEAPEKSPDAAKNFFHPNEVVEDLLLTRTEKREILASWASDLHAVPDAPALRQLENGAVIRLDAILTALQSLDDETSDRTVPEQFQTFPRRLRVAARLKSALRRRWSDDDDDNPPPCPAVITRPPGGPVRGGAVVDLGLALAS